MKLAALLLFCCAMMLKAQQSLTTETEVTSNQEVSHYFIYHGPGVSTMVFYHLSATRQQLLEVAGGPAWVWQKGSLDTYLGMDNYGRLIAATVATAKLPGKLMLIGVSDPKIQLGLTTIPTQWYNRFLIGRGRFYIRADGFYIRHIGYVSRPVGGEIQFPIKKRFELFTFPSFEIITRRFQPTVGLRIKFF